MTPLSTCPPIRPPRAFHRRSGRTAARALVVASLVASLLAGRTALADAARAREHFELAKRYFQVDEYRKAIEEFKAAHIEEPDPAFLYNIAECHRHLGESREALTYYRRFLTLSPANAPSRALAQKRIAEIEAAPGPAAAPTPAPPPAAPPPPAEPAARQPAPMPQPMPVPMPVPPGPAAAPVAMAAVPAADAAVAATPEASPAPFYKRGWFYGVLGAVVIAGAVSAWALSSGGGTNIPNTPLGNQQGFP